ncbi:unnamed protein product [Arctia plantaginis]|uniref:Carboxylesterase type B domain-containing protein n=1 Tax=Arctia plantaginis TaxID=874455 RepID=A0A8S1AGA2_ARCPL|nr:unnamed protein product [Arctia plantaginis]
MACISAVSLLLCLVFQGISGEDVQVTVEQGTLNGEIVTSVIGENYYSFKGIPYAKPPVGALRFKDPEDPISWDGVRDAKVHGSVCPQLNILTNTYIPGSEDCLFVNVYTPNVKPETPLPVLVHIHGGAYLFGSGDTDLYGPDFFVSEMVVVTFNYRLATLGFLSLGNCEVSGNAGLKDQVAALKWVQKNIHVFGGDPTRVTLKGDTAGAASVGYHMVSPGSKGLFHRAIAASGSPFNDFNVGFEPRRRAFVLAQTLGFETNNNNDNDLLEFLQSVEVVQLINITSSSASVLASQQITDLPFKMQPFTAPVVEKACPQGNFLTKDVLTSLESGDVNKVDVMFGYANKESLLLLPAYVQALLGQYNRYRELFVPSKLLNVLTPSTILNLADEIINFYFGDKAISVDNIEEFINYASNVSISYDMQRFFRRWTKFGNTYAFKLSSYSSRNVYGAAGESYGIAGAAHFEDVFYTYDPKSLNLPLTKDSIEYKMIKQITTPMIDFAKTGNPTPDTSFWPKYNCSLAYVNFAEDMTVVYAPDEADYQFWKALYKSVNERF